MLVQILKDGPKNLTIAVRGIMGEDFDPLEILDIRKTAPPSEGWKGVRLDSAVWLVQEKATLRLWWSKDQGVKDLIFPMESRNSVRLDEGLPSPRIIAPGEWPGKIWLSGKRNMDADKAYFFILDLDKQ